MDSKKLGLIVALLTIIILFHGAVQAIASPQSDEVMTNQTIIDWSEQKRVIR